MKENLIKLAIEAQQNSYSPYSNFKVGAALLTKDGKVYKGCNVENKNYVSGCCAEKTALVKAISEGVKDFEAIAVVGNNGFCLPCGSCRQVMSEFCNSDFKIYVTNGNEIKEYKLEELLPYSFELEK